MTFDNRRLMANLVAAAGGGAGTIMLVCAMLGAGMLVCALLGAGPSLAEPTVSPLDRPPYADAAPVRVFDGDGSAGSRTRQPTGAAQPEWHWRLAGILVGPDHRAALFAHIGETRAVSEGQQIDGWTLAAIRPFGVTLTAAGVAITLSLEGFSPEEEAATARLRAEEHERANAAARAALGRQERELQAAHTELTAKTKEMQTR